MFFSTPPDPIAFTLGPLTVHWYGLLIALAAVLGYWLLEPFCKRSFRVSSIRPVCPIGPILDTEQARGLYVYLLLVGFVSARVYHVLTHWGFYGDNLAQIPAIWNGGLAIHGAIIGAAVALLIASREKGVRYHFLQKMVPDTFFPLADVFAPLAALGQAIGRWGNYFNQELFGRPTNLPWAIPIDLAHRPPEFMDAQYFHPAFLYESLWNLAVFGILTIIYFRGQQKKPGTIFWLYLGLYSLGRILISRFRFETAVSIFGVSAPILVSVGLLLISAFCIVFSRYKDAR